MYSVQKLTQNSKKKENEKQQQQEKTQNRKKKLVEIRIWPKKTFKIKHNCDLKTNGIDILTLVRACLVMHDYKDLL